MSYTPGPWELQESPNGGMLLIRGNDPDRMKRHPQTHLQIVPDDDARLIAAAPDLLEAAKALYDACEMRANKEGGDFGDDIGPAAYAVRDAIAKATA